MKFSCQEHPIQPPLIPFGKVGCKPGKCSLQPPLSADSTSVCGPLLTDLTSGRWGWGPGGANCRRHCTSLNHRGGGQAPSSPPPPPLLHHYCCRSTSVPTCDKQISRMLMVVISCETMSLFYRNRQVGSTEEICKHVVQQVMTYDRSCRHVTA